MAKAEEVGPIEPEGPAAPSLTVDALVTALREVNGTGQAPPGDRYRLKLSTFGRDGNVE